MIEITNLRARMESYTEDTYEFAIELASKVVALLDVPDRAIELAYIIESELDKRIRAGTLYLLARENRR